ncbi:hypothetical protein [Nocardioides sp. CFH 31398]|uniref:hypothetical protein n=1 Tax=Nocardioides sp. CFH 31398 TaxID=2919579 RepID=UPI001F05F7BD|nr:hypothetical protein [Nocardioides sp. CFH 31398]MCH1868293.1 hypothetical protein [Nocardioides sp. CFH 31398]
MTSDVEARGRVAWPAVVAVALVGAGALAGVLWWALWTPPTGVALAGRFVLDSDGARADFDATGTYVVIALVLGLVAGLVVGWVTRRDELVVVGVALVAAVAAGLLMYAVGHLLGPADPASLAADAEDYAPLEGDLRLAGSAPFLALPGGLLVGLVVTLLGFARHGGPAPTPPDPGRPDDSAGLSITPGRPGRAR